MRTKEKYDHWFPKLLSISAITIYPYILYSLRANEIPKSLRFHELEHIDQVRRIGWVRFYLSYVLYYLANKASGMSHQKAYKEIPYEKEAVEKASKIQG